MGEAARTGGCRAPRARPRLRAMSQAEELASRLARCVERFRDPAAKEEQKAAFRSLLELVKETGLQLREDEQGVRVNGEVVTALALGALGHRLALHNISEIRVPPSAQPADVFALLQGLAEPPTPSGEDIASRLVTAGATQVRVTVGPPPPETPEAPAGPASTPVLSLGTEGLLRGEPMKDIRSSSADVLGVPGFTHDPDPPAPDEALPTVGSAPASEVVLFSAGGAEPERPQSSLPDSAGAGSEPVTADRESGTVPLADGPGGSDSGRPDAPASRSQPRPANITELLAVLKQQPTGPQVADLLAELGQVVVDAVRAEDFEVALAVLAPLVDVEQRVPEAGRRQYAIALRRMYSKALLHGVGELLGRPGYQAAASSVLQRAGSDGADVLLERLAKVQGMAERRVLFDALRRMREVRTQLLPMLGDPKWFVARNAAELSGELAVEEAVPQLAQLLNHSDERVRKAAALALAKIGTKAAGEPLRRALRDPSPEIRIQVAMGVGGQRAQGLAMPLVVALDDEKEEAVQRELVLALGRIGSADAVQALVKVAQPAGRVFGRKPVALRLAAVDGLRLAATSAAMTALESLSGDADRQVSAAAQGALSDLRRRPK